MGPIRLLLFLCAAILVHGRSCPKKKVYQWDYHSYYWDGPVTTNMTTLDRSLADNITAYKECYNADHQQNPTEREYTYTNEVFGRKKRDVYNRPTYFTMKSSHIEIPFLISTNWTQCEQRRIAIALRKFETKTCLKFIPFENLQKHPQVLMIIGELLVNSTLAYAPFGFTGYVAGTKLNGQEISKGSLVQLPERNLYPIEHEFMHMLGFIHSQDSPYREGPSDWYGRKPGFEVDEVIQIKPWEKNTAVGNMGGDHILTDWDTWKINKFYQCKVTTYGNRPIDMTHTPAPPVNTFK